MKKVSKEKILLISIIGIIILIDQILKLWLQNVNQITIIPNILDFKVFQSFQDNSSYMISNIIIIGIVIKFITSQNEFVDIKLKIFLSFILAGGLSNIIDRIFRGYVMEYIDLSGLINIPNFNIADVFVIIGWISVVAIFTGFTYKEWKNKKVKKVKKENEDKE